MSVSNRVVRNIESTKSALEATIEMKPDEIKADHMKIINSLDMKISSITSNKPSLSYEQPYSNITKWPLLKSSDKYSHELQFTKPLSSMNL